MRILITGVAGQLGLELAEQLRRTKHEVRGYSRAACDIRDAEEVRHAVAETRPDTVINCAAFNAVDAAEAHRETAFRVNAEGPAILAAACRDSGAVLCHISTDFVFDGSIASPIPESAEPNPINVYGASKLAGEEAVRISVPDEHLIIRTSWLYGQHGPNFVLTIRRLAAEGQRLRVVADQTGSPTWTGHLAPAVIHLLELGQRGTFHLSNAGAATRRAFAAAILEESNLAVPVEAITSAEYPTAARRPMFSVLDNGHWRELGEPALPAWREGLRTYLAPPENRS